MTWPIATIAPAKLIDCKQGQPYDGDQRGIYVVASTVESFSDRVRIGSAGGSRNSQGRLKDRVPKHCSEHRGFVKVATHELMPYKPLLIWELPNWPWMRVGMAELALYEAVEELGWQRHEGKLKDTSNYILPPDGSLADLATSVSAKLENIRPV